MRVYHLRRRRLGLLAAAAAVLAAALLLAGCLGRSGTSPEAVMLADEAARLDFLSSLGWQAEPGAVETLELQLPDPLEGPWSSYAELQTTQGLPFAQCAGRTVQRYTYAVTNYPDIPRGVQANLYLCDGQLVGGDIIFTGQGGFQKDLCFPGREK